MKFVYPAVFKETPSGFQVSFPDLEGCRAEGPTLDDAIDQAKEAETNWILLELEDSFDLPPRSRLEDIPLEDGCSVRNVTVTLRLTDGYDE